MTSNSSSSSSSSSSTGFGGLGGGPGGSNPTLTPKGSVYPGFGGGPNGFQSIQDATKELISLRFSICVSCDSFRDEKSKPPYSQPFCVQKCGANLKYKWGNTASRCCIGKW